MNNDAPLQGSWQGSSAPALIAVAAAGKDLIDDGRAKKAVAELTRD